MSVATTAAKIFGGIILGIFLIGIVTTSSMAQFTEYNNLQPTFAAMFSQQMPVNESQFPQIKAALTLYCQQPGRTSVNFADVFQGSTNITLRCSDISSVTNGQGLVQLAAVGMFDSIYYKNYTCDFISCVTQMKDQDLVLVLVSAHANSFFKTAMMWAIAGIVAGLALMIFAIRKPFGIAKAVGIEMLISGAVAYVGINIVKGMIPAMPTGADAISQLIGGLFGTMLNNFMIVLAIGAVLVVVGFAGARFVERPKKPAKKKK